MATTMPKAGEVDRKWYVLDAAGKPLGRVAAQAAHLLRGKHKPTFAPHVDCGDNVIIINCDKAVLTGNKLEKKYYYWHTGWIDRSKGYAPAQHTGCKSAEASAHLQGRRAQAGCTEAGSL